MRRVDKPIPGTKVQLKEELGYSPKEVTVNAIYPDYQDAKPVLASAMGPYCSYCETKATGVDLQVEHIQPKGLPLGHEKEQVQERYSRKTSWNNFLLACGRCNGPDNKGIQDPVERNALLPDRHDTLNAFVYTDDGRVSVKDGLDEVTRQMAEESIRIFGLNKILGDANWREGDARFANRKQAFVLVSRHFLATQVDTLWQSVFDAFKPHGHFSILYQETEGNEAFRQALNAAWPGTHIPAAD